MIIGLIVTNTANIAYMSTYAPRNSLEKDTTHSYEKLLKVVTISMAADMIRYFAW
jgi:hypothetical protein